MHYEGSFAVVKDLKCDEWEESGWKFEGGRNIKWSTFPQLCQVQAFPYQPMSISMVFYHGSFSESYNFTHFS